jgi:spectinomycin phosphotransferase
MILEAIERGYGIRSTSLTPIEGGADAYALTFKVVDEDGRELFVKTSTSLDPGMALCIALKDAGIEEVLASLRDLEGRSAHPMSDGVLLVYPWIEGSNGLHRPPGLEQWQKLGNALRRIHDSRLPPEVLSLLATESFRVPGTKGFVELMARLLAGGAQHDVETALAEAIETHRARIEESMRREEELGEYCRQREWPLVPCHSDVHMANVLVDAAGNVHIVDWDAPRLAPRECDLMFFFAPGILGAHGKAEEEAFFEGYGEYAYDPQLISYYRLEREVSDIVSFAHEAATLETQTLDQKWEALSYFKGLFA